LKGRGYGDGPAGVEVVRVTHCDERRELALAYTLIVSTLQKALVFSGPSGCRRWTHLPGKQIIDLD
jgi:hypothetical protein